MEIELKDIALFILAIGSLLTLISLVWAIWTLRSRPEKIQDLNHHFSRQSFATKALAVFAVFGFCLITYAGFEALLSWLPETWGHIDEDGDWVPLSRLIASAAGLFGGFILVSILLAAAEDRVRSDDLRRELDEAHSDLSWLRHSIDYLGFDLSDDELKAGLFTDPRRPDNSPLREKTRMEWLKALRARDSKTVVRAEQQVADAEIKRAEESRLQESLIENERRHREAEEQHRAAKKKLRLIVDSPPPLLSLIERNDEKEVALIDPKSAAAIWNEFRKRIKIGSIEKSGPQSAEIAKSAIENLVASTDGLALRQNCQLSTAWQGDAHGGHVKLQAHKDAEEISLPCAFEVSLTPEALLTAFLISSINYTSWGWWHGLYDRDYSFVEDYAELEREVLAGASKSTLTFSGPSIPSPGFRVRNDGEAVSVASLALRPGGNLFDIVAQFNGWSGALKVTSLLSGSRMLY